MDLPDTEPVYVAPALTAPNEIALPRTLPVIPYVPEGFESLMEPLKAPETDCLQ